MVTLAAPVGLYWYVGNTPFFLTGSTENYGSPHPQLCDGANGPSHGDTWYTDRLDAADMFTHDYTHGLGAAFGLKMLFKAP